MSSQLILESKDRITLSTANNCVLSINNIVNGKYKLKQFLFQNSCYNITANNNVVYFYENSISKACTLTPGYYTSSGFTSHLKTQIDAASGGYNTYTITYSSTTGLISISASNAFKFMFGTNLNNSAAYVMGFEKVDSALATSQVSPNALNLVSPYGLFVDITQVMCNISNPVTSKICSFFVPLVNEFGQLEVFQPSNDQRIEFDFSRITNQIKIKIVDTNFNLNILNGVDWVMILEKI
jgi:hypothetical protein